MTRGMTMKISHLATLLFIALGIAVNASAARLEVPVNINKSPTDSGANQKTSVAANNAVSKPIPVTTPGGTSICTQRQISSYYMNTYKYKKACFSKYISRQYQ